MRYINKFIPRLTLFLLFLFIGSGVCFGQEAIKIGKKVRRHKQMTASDIYAINNMITISDTLSGWQVHWRGAFQGTQASFSNWSNGGVNAISGTASTLFAALYRKNRFGYALGINLKYGRAYLANQGGRKTGDYIAINNKFSHRFKNEHWNAFININLVTQFTRGYNFSVPDSVGKELISAFFSPAYFNQILGIGFSPNGHFTAEAGLALKETVVKNDLLSEQYGLDPGDNFRLETGYSIRLSYSNEILDNISLSSSFETFTNINRAFRHTDFIFSNRIIGEINNLISLTFEFDIAYNDNFSDKLQIKEVLAAGISFTFI